MSEPTTSELPVPGTPPTGIARSAAARAASAPPASIRPRRPPLSAVLASPKMLAILLMGAASGYPNQLTESALQAWLKESGASNTTIGLMSYVALPYVFKFLWAPFIDRYPLPLLGRRRGWMLVSQLVLGTAIALLALQNPAAALAPVAVCAVAIVFFSATQDIVIDAYRTDIALPAERGPAAALTNLGYRTCAWLASGLALLVADYFGWRLAFLVLGGVMLLFTLATWFAPEPDGPQQAPRSLRESVFVPLQELLAGPGALALLAVVLLFKIGDAFAMKLFTPFMLDEGFTKTELAVVVKSLFTGGALVGAVLGGIVMVRLGLWRSMLIFGVAQAVTNLLYCALAAAGKSYTLMAIAVVIEHVAGAMGNIALVALIMALCDTRYSAFQYALLSSLALLPRYGLGYPAGWVADHGGWFIYYVVSFVIALPGLAIVWVNRDRINALDQQRA
ncbi:MAG TPA: MFS transporter [Steroidobacteraceae bacterium]|nr:MFS transporter [Steroidobacteraceae bacterium]